MRGTTGIPEEKEKTCKLYSVHVILKKPCKSLEDDSLFAFCYDFFVDKTSLGILCQSSAYTA